MKKGEPLFRVYSPDMVKVQVDYRISTNAGGNRDNRGALQRLQNLQLPQAVMDQLQRTREPVISRAVARRGKELWTVRAAAMVGMATIDEA